MCGIFGLIEDYDSNNENEYKTLIENVKDNLSHRGPDTTGNNLIVDKISNKNVLMVHTRLRINGNNTSQPMTNNDKTLYLIINGEIFNWKELSEELNYTCTMSDCEIIFPLYSKYKNDISTFFNKLKGQFSLFLYDTLNKHILIGRDQIGVTPLYIGHKNSVKTKYGLKKNINRFVISSELKCLTANNLNDKESLVDNIKVFYPRKYIYTSIVNNNYFDSIQDYSNFYTDYTLIDTQFPDNILHEREIIMDNIKSKLELSVKSQLEDLITQEDPPDFGVLLSGGLDSSLIASLVVKISKELGYTRKIKTFSIGVNSTVPDLVAARTVSHFLDTEHYEYYFSIDEGINSIEDVIWYTETYDCTSIRASTPMFLLTKSIKKNFPNLKVVFSGELSDELLCYLYGANAPSENDFQIETVNLVSNVHLFDCLRANKTSMANSIEVRVPFTDIDFVTYILSLHPRWKMFGKNAVLRCNKMEKQILRDSFYGYLPNEILYRKKEQFSDGVSGFDGKENNWIDGIKYYCKNKFTNESFDELKMLFTHNRPDTKEKLLYRIIFCKLFNNSSYKNTSEFTIKTWEPKWSNTNDPSGRAQNFWEKN